MTEKDDPFAFHDPRYAAVGDLVVRAADQAQAELEAIEQELFTSSFSGHATMKALEERRALAESDASALSSMASVAQTGPAYAFNGRHNGARPASPASPAETAASVSDGSGDTDHQIERIRHHDARTKEVFEERASRYVRFMVSQGAAVKRRDGVSPNKIIRDGIDMTKNTWGNFSIRLRQFGLLTYEKDPTTKKILEASMDLERVAEFIKVGDLPQDLAAELEKLDDYTEPEDDPEVDDADDVGDEEYGEAKTQRHIIVDKEVRDALSAIHTRNTGAHLHQRGKG